MYIFTGLHLRNAGLFAFQGGSSEMETRIAIIGIIVEDTASTGRVNELLHECAEFIVGRMGIPYR